MVKIRLADDPGKVKFIFIDNSVPPEYYIVTDISEILDIGLPIDEEYGEELKFVGETLDFIENGKHIYCELKIR